MADMDITQLDNAQNAAPASLSNMILDTDDETWKKLRAVLKVQTREEAAELVATSKEAAKAAESVLSTASKTMLTDNSEQTMLGDTGTAPASTGVAPQRNPAEVLYGRKGKKAGLRF